MAPTVLKRAASHLPVRVQEGLRAALAVYRDAARAREIRAAVPPGELETPRCALCGGHNVVKHLRRHGFTVVRCRRDGLLFVSPRPRELAPYYDARYYSGGLPDVYPDYEAFAGTRLREPWRGRLERVEAALGRTGELLDVGCATGAFLRLARERGWGARGLELSAWAVEQARAHGLDVTCGTLPQPALPDGSFDAVAFLDAIEHVADPRAVLGDIRRLLKPDGVLLLTTGVLAHEDPRRASSWYYPPWHLYYFSRTTMEALLLSCGLRLLAYREENADSSWGVMEVLASPAGGSAP